MSKRHKISYSIIYNHRLKEVDFQGKVMLPLYIRMIYNRESTLLKSYYFDIYSKPSYYSESIDGIKPISIEKIIEKEKELLDFILKNDAVDFSLEIFKTEYYYYSRNIISLMEDLFRAYLKTFFQDEGFPVLSSLISEASVVFRSDTLLKDLKSSLKIKLYSKLLENAVYYAPPYIPVMAFIDSLKPELQSYLPVYVWENLNTRKQFENFLIKEYPLYQKNLVFDYVDSLIKA